MRLIDLHCDTPHRLYAERLAFDDERLQVSAPRLQSYENMIQVFSVWSDKNLSDQEAYAAFWDVRRNLLDALDRCRKPSDFKFYLSIEDGRMLCGDIERLELLHGAGVRFLTLMWHGSTLLGGACDTDDPLMPFGRQVVRRCFELGVVPDVSHASRRVIEEVAELASEAKKPFVATHSNSYSIVPHRRNLTDDRYVHRARGGCFRFHAERAALALRLLDIAFGFEFIEIRMHRRRALDAERFLNIAHGGRIPVFIGGTANIAIHFVFFFGKTLFHGVLPFQDKFILVLFYHSFSEKANFCFIFSKRFSHLFRKQNKIVRPQ